MRARIPMLVGGMLLLGASRLLAQAWDAPSFLPPRRGDDLGAYFVDPSGGDWGLVGIWRQTGNLNLGVRAGVVDRELAGAGLAVRPGRRVVAQ